MTTCGGMGPWFCALLFNTSEECKKQTHLLAHTLPHLAPDVLNKSESDDCWVTIIKVGPFEVWDECVAYLNLWTLRTRGRLRRLERGIEIFRKYAKPLGLTFWYQNETRETIMEQHKRYKRSKRIVPTETEETKKRPRATSASDNIQLENVEEIFCTGVPMENITLGMIKSAQFKKAKK